MATVHVVVSVIGTAPRTEVSVEVNSAMTLAELLALLVRDFGLDGRVSWAFEMQDEVIDPSWTVRELVGRSGSRPPLQLVLRALGAPGATAPPAPGARPDFGTAPDTADEDEDESPASFEVSERGPASRSAETARVKAKRRHESLDASAERRPTERRATVRYYTRMNPDRMFPLLVILSAEEIAEIVKTRVKQAQSEAFTVDEGSVVEVEPVLPGCDCYPPRAALSVEPNGDSTTTIWVVPKVLGRVEGARVIVRQGTKVLAEVPLDVKVAKQTLAVACGLLSLAAPYLTMGLKSLKLDYESQKAQGFAVYQRVGSWVAENLRPEWLGFGFLGLAVLLYFWMRPRRRDVFWDIDPKRAGP